MATEQAIRASDSDREHTVEALRDQFAEGRLTLEEFDERSSAAYEAKTWTDLRKLTRDLPIRLGLGSTSAPDPVPAGPSAGPAMWRFVPLIPLAFIAFVLASAGGWHHHRHGVFPFFPVIPLAIFGAILAWRWLASRHQRPWR